MEHHGFYLEDKGGRRQPVTITPHNGESNPVIIGMCVCVCVCVYARAHQYPLS
jgi:hypothetical protein